MPTFLLFLGFLVIVLCPMLSVLYAEAKIIVPERKKIIFFLAFIPGCLIFVLATVLNEDHPPVISKACGIVRFYKTYAVRHDYFERIAIQFDASRYNRHLRFSDDLIRKQKGERVCFEFYDRLKDKDVSESKVIRWLEPTEMQTIASSNQIK